MGMFSVSMSEVSTFLYHLLALTIMSIFYRIKLLCMYPCSKDHCVALQSVYELSNLFRSIYNFKIFATCILYMYKHLCLDQKA